LSDPENHAAGQSQRPRLAQTAPPVDDGDQCQGDEDGQDRSLAPDHRPQNVCGQTGYLGQGDDRRGHCPECNGGGIRNERQLGRLERFEAQGKQHHRGDRDGRTESGQRLEQRTEGERDDDGLDAVIIADRGEAASQDIKCPVCTVIW
jgi:hypothetical protein